MNAMAPDLLARRRAEMAAAAPVRFAGPGIHAVWHPTKTAEADRITLAAALLRDTPYTITERPAP
jgi:hypothetical protein